MGQLYGHLAGSTLVATTDGTGLPVTLTSPPEVPAGYELRQGWAADGSSITQTWALAPVEGTAQEAALALSRLQAMSLPDNALYELRALADEYVDGMTCYGEGNEEEMPVTRCRYAGRLFRFIGQGTQVMQPGWNPVDAPSLWAEILPGQEGSGEEVGEWVQPDSTNPYSLGDRVYHGGRLWESTTDGNVWEPGAVGAPWEDRGPWPAGETEGA